MSDTSNSPPSTQAGFSNRLTDCPNWVYLLREFDALYRYGSAGGSPLIRGHRKRVRDRLSAAMAINPEIIKRDCEMKPVVAHLPRALDLGERGAMQGMARALREVKDNLSWEYGYERISKALSQKYAYCEILGRKARFSAKNLSWVSCYSPRTRLIHSTATKRSKKAISRWPVRGLKTIQLFSLRGR